MLRLLLLVLWPVAGFAVGYWLWRYTRQRKGLEIPTLNRATLGWVTLICLMLAMAGFIILGLVVSSNEGHYQPATFQDGTIIEPKVE